MNRVLRIVSAHLSPVISICAGLTGCDRAPTLLVQNTSGLPQEIRIWGDSDVFAVDTIKPSVSWCWLPSRLAHRTVAISVANLQFINDNLGVIYRPWHDSLQLTKSWTLYVRRTRVVVGSGAWEDRRHSALRAAEHEIGREITGYMSTQDVPR